MVGLIAIGEAVVCGGVGAAVGGSAAAAVTLFNARSKLPNGADFVVNVVRKKEPIQERLVRELGRLSKVAGAILSTTGGAATGGAFALSHFEKSYRGGNYKSVSATEAIFDVLVVSLFALSVLGLGLIVLGSRLERAGNVSLDKALNNQEIIQVINKPSNQVETAIQRQKEKEENQLYEHARF